MTNRSFAVTYRPIAMGALKPVDACLSEVNRMRVLPNFQRHGFGQAILTALETRARALGSLWLVLDTSARELAAQSLY